MTGTEGEYWWAEPSAVTALSGEVAAAVDRLPADMVELRRVSSGLVFHYRAGGDFAANGVPPERISETDLRFAGPMLERLLERGQLAPDTDRPAASRVVGCCRDSAVLLVALARHHGIPARIRVGFAAYFIEGWMVDHVVTELWDAEAGRWRRVEAEIGEKHVSATSGRVVDVLDVPTDEFLDAPTAWRAVRDGKFDPSRFVVHPELQEPSTRGLPQIACNVMLDLAGLAKTEMLQWDSWGIMPVAATEWVETLDEVARATVDPGVAPATVAELLSRDGLRVTPVVHSYSPAAGPQDVDVREALAAPDCPTGAGCGRQPSEAARG